MNTSKRFEALAFKYNPRPSKRRRKNPAKSRKGEKARIKPLPKVGQKLWVETYDKVLPKFKDKGVAAAIAWATVKKSCYKDYMNLWLCPELESAAEMKKRVAKARREMKAAAREERRKEREEEKKYKEKERKAREAETEEMEKYRQWEKELRETQQKMSEEEAAARVRRLRM